MKRNIILLPDGYNGQKIKCFTKPILERDGHLIKLQIAEPGKEYMFKWVRQCDYDLEIGMNSRYGGFKG